MPEHLRNAPTKLMKELGYGKLYRYAHDEPDAYAAGETYLPDGMAEPHWYQPTPRGLEGKIAEKRGVSDDRWRSGDGRRKSSRLAIGTMAASSTENPIISHDRHSTSPQGHR